VPVLAEVPVLAGVNAGLKLALWLSLRCG